MTAQLPCHVQNFVAITLLHYAWEQSKSLLNLNYSRQVASEMAHAQCSQQANERSKLQNGKWICDDDYTSIQFRTWISNQINLWYVITHSCPEFDSCLAEPP